MPQILSNLSALNLSLIYIAAVIIGLNKSGLRGIDMLNVMIMALIFGSRQSTGIVLPLLCFGDIMAAFYYKKQVNWSLFWKLIIWMAIGIIIAVLWGQNWPEAIFKKVFAGIIVVSIFILIWQDRGGLQNIHSNPVFTPIMGIVTGFTTMMGNLAGAFATIYFTAQKLNKNDFIGTVSIVFLVVNLFKVPFQVIFWKNIGSESLTADLWLLPATILGFYTGKYLVKNISEAGYKKVVMVLTLLGALSLLLAP